MDENWAHEWEDVGEENSSAIACRAKKRPFPGPSCFSSPSVDRDTCSNIMALLT